MKKTITLMCLLLASMVGMQANAELWLIGAISPYGWDPSQGVQFEQVDDNNYTLDLEVTTTGQQYYALTTQLGADKNDWDGIKPYRFGGTMEVQLDTDVVLEAGTDQSPYTKFAQTGTYTFTFDMSSNTMKVTLKDGGEAQTFNGTIYITKNSIGNIWAWDAVGNYFESWPGKAISELETGVLNDVEYYTFTYTNNSTGPGIIFNDGTNQTSDLVPVDGNIYEYLGGTTVNVTNPSLLPGNDVFILGEVNGNGWATNVGVQMATTDNVTYTAEITTDGANSGYSYFSFSRKLADGATDWDLIAPFRFGATSNDFLISSDLLGTPLGLDADGTSNAFMIVAGTYKLTLNMEQRTLIVEGYIEPEPTDVFIMGEVNGNGWFPNVGVPMSTTDNVVYTADVYTTGANEGYSYFSFTKKLAEGDADTDWDTINAYRFGATTDEDYEITSDMIGTEIALSGDGKSTAFKIPAGEYKFTVDLSKRTLVISGSSEPVPTNVYIMGEVNDNGGWFPNVGTLMNTEDNVIYTARVSTQGENDGYSYFSFTKKLADSAADTDWDAINAYRFGATTDEDYAITNEMLDTEIPVSADGKATAFKIGAGLYDFTLNLQNRTLVIKAASGDVYGDVNGDGAVNVSDVTELVNMILEVVGMDMVKGDINGDGSVNVSDVTELVNYILSM